MDIKIKRIRYAITRNDTDILCGLARSFYFTSIENMNNDGGTSALKTYVTEKKAITSFMQSWGKKIDNKVYKVIKVLESLEQIK